VKDCGYTLSMLVVDSSSCNDRLRRNPPLPFARLVLAARDFDLLEFELLRVNVMNLIRVPLAELTIASDEQTRSSLNSPQATARFMPKVCEWVMQSVARLPEAMLNPASALLNSSSISVGE